MMGMCGDLDGNRYNDFVTAEGQRVNDDQDGYNKIGNSWQITDTEEPQCKNTASELVCSLESRKTAMAKEYCGLMLDLEGPFSQCLTRINQKGHVDSCMFDVCANEGRLTLMKELACGALSVMNRECHAVGAMATGWEAILGCDEEIEQKTTKHVEDKGHVTQPAVKTTQETPGFVEASSWGNWSSCSRSCNGGVQERMRWLVANNAYKMEVQRRICNKDECAEVTTWAAWSRCSRTCDFGLRTRVCRPGQSCPAAKQTELCMVIPCFMVQKDLDIGGPTTGQTPIKQQKNPCLGYATTFAPDPDNCARFYLCTQDGAPVLKCCKHNRQWSQMLQTCVRRSTCTNNCRIETSPTPQTQTVPTGHQVVSTTATPSGCLRNYRLYMPFDDFSDVSCNHPQVCLHGRPKIEKTANRSVLLLDGNSYVEIPSVTGKQRPLHRMTVMVRFKVMSLQGHYGVILSIWKRGYTPVVLISVDAFGKLKTAVHGEYFKQINIREEWTTLSLNVENNKGELYINGDHVESKEITEHYMSETTEAPVVIGGGAEGTNDKLFMGYIDQVMIEEQTGRSGEDSSSVHSV